MLFILLMACTSPEETQSSLESSFELGEIIPNVVVATIDSQVEGVAFVEWGADTGATRTTRRAHRRRWAI